MTKHAKDKNPPLPDDQLGTNQGEGNIEASRHYNEATRDFVESGRVGDAARQARPDSAGEARSMEQAEQAGRARAREEDPALQRGAGRPSGRDTLGDTGRDTGRDAGRDADAGGTARDGSRDIERE